MRDFEGFNNLNLLWTKCLTSPTLNALISASVLRYRKTIIALAVCLEIEHHRVVIDRENAGNTHPPLRARQTIFAFCAGYRAASAHRLMGVANQLTVIIAKLAHTTATCKLNVLFNLFGGGRHA